MAKWLPPHGFTCTVHHLDARVNGAYKMSFTNFTTGRSHSFGGTYLELIPGELIRYADRFDDPNLPGDIQVTGFSLRERKRLLRGVVPAQPSPVLYVDHVAENGTALFEEVCARDLEGIVAKLANAPYTPESTTWVKIKNRNYSQAVGRSDFFDGRVFRAVV